MNYCKEKLSYDSIYHLYKNGCKEEKNIGMEYERIPVDRKTFESVSYYGFYGVCELLKEFATIDNWDYILDNEEIIGLKKLHDTITLEPGSQIEMSLEPQKNVSELKNKVEQIDSVLALLFDKYGIKLLNYGVSPISTYKNISLIPKSRYKYMAEYLWGILSDVMMRETAGIQVGIDFESEEDAMAKFFTANIMSPFMTAIYANSSIRGGVDTGYKSFRGLAWLNTDNERCGFATGLRPDLLFDNYINSVLESPMIFIQRGKNLIYINGKITFKQFMKYGYQGYEADIEDYKLQANLFFPDVRLRQFIEIRNHDCVGGGLEYSIPAIYKGIMYNKDAMAEVWQLFKTCNSNDIEEFRYNVPRTALDTKIKGISAKDIAIEIQNIAYQSLDSQSDNDSEFILPIMELTKQGLTPADVMKSCL